MWSEPGAVLRRAVRHPWVFGLALMLAHLMLVMPILARHGFDASVFIVAGDHFVTATETPSRIIVRALSDGYDGQFYYRLALAPLRPEAHAYGVTLDHPAWRAQRILYPLLARLLSMGVPAMVPWAMFFINLMGLVAIGALGCRVAALYGLPPVVPLAIALWPGWLVTLTHDTTEILAGALLLGAVCAFAQRRWVAYAMLMALAALTRETAILVAGGVFIRESKQFFFEKKNQKTFAPTRYALRQRVLQLIKVFASFFKKKRFLSLLFPVLPFLAWRETVAVLWHSTPQAHGVAENASWPLLGWAEILLANLINHAIGAAAHPRGMLMRITMLGAIGAISVFCVLTFRAAVAGLRPPGRMAGLALGWLFVLALMSLFTANGPWVEPTAYARAFAECWIVGWIVLGGFAQRPRVPPWVLAVWLPLMLRNWQLCWIQLK
jgi:hypothetical protein